MVDAAAHDERRERGADGDGEAGDGVGGGADDERDAEQLGGVRGGQLRTTEARCFDLAHQEVIPVVGVLAGQLGLALQPLFAPIGFGWEIVVALVPGMAAREVAVGALGTVYALSASGETVAESLAPVIAQSWSSATAYSLLAWFVFAPQCISTLVTVRRETGGWRYPALMAGYLFALAYAAAFVTYRVALALGG